MERAYENIDNLDWDQQSDPRDQEIDFLRDALAFKSTEVREAESWILKVEAERDAYRDELADRTDQLGAAEIRIAELDALVTRIKNIASNGVMADETMRLNILKAIRDQHNHEALNQ